MSRYPNSVSTFHLIRLFVILEQVHYSKPRQSVSLWSPPYYSPTLLLAHCVLPAHARDYTFRSFRTLSSCFPYSTPISRTAILDRGPHQNEAGRASWTTCLFSQSRSEFAQQVICIILLSRQQNQQKFEVTQAKKIKKYQMFLHFYAFEHLNIRNQPAFLMVRSGLEKYQLRKSVGNWTLR